MQTTSSANGRRIRRLSQATYQKALLAAQTRMREYYLSGRLEAELEAVRLSAQHDDDGAKLA